MDQAHAAVIEQRQNSHRPPVLQKLQAGSLPVRPHHHLLHHRKAARFK
jgi:hypothetical protein